MAWEQTLLTADGELLKRVCVCVWKCTSVPSLPAQSPACVWSHHFCLCVFQRGAQRTAVNKDITSASMKRFLPPTGRGVVGAMRRKQERQEWKRSVFAPAGWWACEGESGRDEGKEDDKKEVLLLAWCRHVNQGWKGQKKDFIIGQRSCDLCSLWGSLCFLSVLLSLHDKSQISFLIT